MIDLQQPPPKPVLWRLTARDGSDVPEMTAMGQLARDAWVAAQKEGWPLTFGATKFEMIEEPKC